MAHAIIVTGAASGIGRAIALALHAEGHQVLAADRDAKALATLPSALRTVVADFAQPDSFAHVAATALVAFGRIDVLVNNAGISGSAVGDPDAIEGWNKLIAVNQTSVFLGTKLAAAEMMKTGGGSIINISSINGFVGSDGGHPGYHASKGAVRIYSKAAAVRYGPQGIRVNTVHPGYLPPMLNGTNANSRALAVAQTPLRRIGVPTDVAYGVLYLASDESSFVTGSELVIDGGWLAQ
jgi:cyclopentanol dehydrogenase